MLPGVRKNDLRGVGMTRRDFLIRITTAGSILTAWVWATAKKVLPKRFVLAKQVSKYPGRIKEIETGAQSKWSG